MASENIDGIISSLRELNESADIIKAERFVDKLYKTLESIKYLDDEEKETALNVLEDCTELQWFVGDCDSVAYTYNMLMDW